MAPCGSNPLQIDFKRNSEFQRNSEKVSPFDKFLVDPLGDENLVKCEELKETDQNLYFNHGITLPKIETRQVEQVTRRAERWGFLELFQRTQGKDLCKGNPWLHKESAEQKRQEIAKRRKRVRFSLTEMSPTRIPHCRRNDIAESKFGHLHSERCKNSASEKSSGSDDMEWKSRAFLLESCVGKLASRSDFYIRDTPSPTMDLNIVHDRTCDEGEEGFILDLKSNAMDSIEVRKTQTNHEMDVEEGPATKPHPIPPPDVMISKEMISNMLESDEEDFEEDDDDFLKSMPNDYKSCDSAYESSDNLVTSDHSTSDYDSDDDFDISDLISSNKPGPAKMWFKNRKEPEPTVVESREATPTPNVYLNPYNSKPAAAKVSLLQKPSILGKLLCTRNITRITVVTLPEKLQEFLFDSMSPDDIVISKQSVVFK